VPAGAQQGARLRQIALVRGRAHRIVKAIEILRKEYEKPLRAAALACGST
jgi:hypothetical protein